MNKIRLYHSMAWMVAMSMSFAGCSDQFLEDKKVYGSYDGSVVYENYETAEGRVDYLYQCLLPNATGGDNALTDVVSAGINDNFSQCTEEYGGYSVYNDPAAVLTNQTITDYFYVINNVTSPWGRIRECNDIIEGVEGSASLSQSEKELLLGQAYFFRAWRYYLLVKFYGGVPIVDYVQSPIIGDGNGEDLVIPRSSTKDCIDFICNDLDLAARYLPVRWTNEAQNFGRITAGAALALKGRVLLMYASPLFNRSDNKERWEAAYQANSAAVDKLAEGNFGLGYAGSGGEHNAKDWARMFATQNGGGEEAVFITLYNNKSPVEAQNVDKYNLWEQGIRPVNANGSGSRTPTAEMVDLFPMADGKKPGESEYVYDRNKFFMNRDPRFYRTFAFPGVEWRFNGGENTDFTGDKMSTIWPIRYRNGNDYELWSYCWYATEDDKNSESKSGYAADMLGTSNKGVYLRKRSDDYAFGTNLYKFNDLRSSNRQGFGQSAAPYMEIRYAEVLLNLAESACGAEHYNEAVRALKDIRARVGYTEEENYGLNSNIENDRAKLFEAILYERQIELAYEGKRFEDMRRWMLFDGGVGQASLHASWGLTGFGGNTCAYLGVTPMNERGKRHRIEIYVDGLGEANNQSDPLANVTRPDGLTLDEDMTIAIDESNVPTTVKNLYDFYTTYFRRKDISLDGNTNDINPTFRPEYYFFGLRQSAQQTNATLLQTIGWTDYSHGGMGTFDPLAE